MIYFSAEKSDLSILYSLKNQKSQSESQTPRILKTDDIEMLYYR